jgi:DNA-binding YbaB/EbfC family protein
MADKPSLTDLMNMAKKMQDSMREVQEILENKRFEGNAGAGMIVVTMNGKKRVISTAISEAAYKSGKDVLEDLATAAFNSASEKVDDFSGGELKKLTQSLGLPPDFEMPSGE